MTGIRAAVRDGARRGIRVGWASVACALAVLVGAPSVALAAGGSVAGNPAAGGGPIVTTIAGGAGGPGPATSVTIGSPCGLTSFRDQLVVGTAAHGQVFGETVDDQGPGVVRDIRADTGQLTNLAGSTYLPTPGLSSPDGIPAADAEFNQSCDVAMDHFGNLVFADSASVNPGFRHATGNRLIRVVAETSGTFYGVHMNKGTLHTIAGTNGVGQTGNGVPATLAAIGIPAGVAVDSAGNVVFATVGAQNLIQVIAEKPGTFYGQAMKPGLLYTVAGGGSTDACAPGQPDGQPATSIELGITSNETKRNQLTEPSGLRIDRKGNIVVAEAGCGSRIQVIAALTGVDFGRQLTVGDIYTIAGGGTASPAGNGLAIKARLDDPSGIALDHTGNLIIADTSAHAIRVVAVKTHRFYGRPMIEGHIYTLAGGHGKGSSGDGGPATRARLFDPSAVAVDGPGNIAIADTGNDEVRLIAVRTASFYGKALNAGDIYTIAGPGTGACSGNGGLATQATIGGRAQIAADPAGDTLVLTGDRSCPVRLVAARTRALFGAQRTASHLYTLAVPASLTPRWAASDPTGNAVLASGTKIVVIAAQAGEFYGIKMTAGHAYEITGTGSSTASGAPVSKAKLTPLGLAVDSHGDIITGDHVIAETTGTLFGQQMIAGHVYVLPVDDRVQAVDQHGNAVVINSLGTKVQVIAALSGTFYGQPMTAGQVVTVAGTGSLSTFGDGGPAVKAGLFTNSVAVDAAGNLIIGNFVRLPSAEVASVRVVAVSTGTFYGQHIAAGNIDTVAGGGNGVADGTTAVRTRFDGPIQVVIASGSTIVVSSQADNVIREIK